MSKTPEEILDGLAAQFVGINHMDPTGLIRSIVTSDEVTDAQITQAVERAYGEQAQRLG